LRDKGYPVYPGALGENLTTEGLPTGGLRAGQQYRIGQAIVELTRPRAPCNTLNVYGPAIKEEVYDQAVKSGDFTSRRWALAGFYARVVRPGMIFPGDPIELLSDSC
jgi:MOSC domain-containing protein YiiM